MEDQRMTQPRKSDSAGTAAERLIGGSRAGVAGTRMFTFSISSSTPKRRVRCHNCDWTTSGNGRDVFGRADVHECKR